jgi:flavin-dependent dehydrogenase
MADSVPIADADPQGDASPRRLLLDDGSRVAVIGGGPAGSFFTTFLLDMAERVGLDVKVDVFEPRDFDQPAPIGCNMCGGIISESLVQNLAAEGVNLPETVVQRGIDSYVLHMDVGSVRIETPLQEMRIAAVYRGPGPRDIKERKWGSFDHHLQQLTEARGAQVINDRVVDVAWVDGRPEIQTKGGFCRSYDLLAVAVGVNSPALKLFEAIDVGYRRPTTTKTLIREYYLGEEVISDTLGSSMHVFLLNLPRLEFAALIPKGDYVTMCLLGDDIDKDLIDAFAGSPEVRAVMPSNWAFDVRSCQCQPRINVVGARKPYGDRLLFIGDCGVARLYKDGIGAAYRTAKAAARTAVFEGVSEKAFARHFRPACDRITRDNRVGKVTFAVTRQIQRYRLARRAVLRMTREEQSNRRLAPRMSGVMWDMFSGSAPYTDIFKRTLHPAFIGRLGWSLVASLAPWRPPEVAGEQGSSARTGP